MMTRTAGLAGQQHAWPDHKAACTSDPGSVVACDVFVADAGRLSPIWVELPRWIKPINML
jgi:hypothetical protein